MSLDFNTTQPSLKTHDFRSLEYRPATVTNPRELSEYIDHTLLRPEATEDQIRKLCEEAAEFRFKTVCIESKWLTAAQKFLSGTKVLPITVIGFPGGAVPTAQKVEEAKRAGDLGARELDMVLNRGWLAARDHAAVFADVRAVVEAAGKLPVKVILETSELTGAEKIAASALCKAAGAAFVKTSTGFSKSGATVEDVALMRATVGSDLGVKASGGIRSTADALKMIAAGATRLGTSASVAIVTGESAGGGKY